MDKVWDNSLSTLLNSHPQAFLDLLLPGARCLQQHRTKLSGTQRQPDAVLEVERYGEIFIFNPEFQSAQDKKMAARLLLYHMLLWNEFQRKDEYKEKDLAIRACVLALLERAKIPPSPLVWTQPGEPSGQQVERVRFSYEVVELWKIRCEVLLALGHVALYPLLPLTEGGTTREIIVTMFDRLPGKQNRDFAAIGFAFATLRLKLLKRESDLQWLEERFFYMDDLIRESPLYEWILEEGEAKGVTKGVAQMRQTVVEIVQDRFPELVQLAEEVVATVDNLPQLGRLSARLGGAQDAEQARQILSALAQ